VRAWHGAWNFIIWACITASACHRLQLRQALGGRRRSPLVRRQSLRRLAADDALRLHRWLIFFYPLPTLEDGDVALPVY